MARYTLYFEVGALKLNDGTTKPIRDDLSIVFVQTKKLTVRVCSLLVCCVVCAPVETHTRAHYNCHYFCGFYLGVETNVNVCSLVVYFSGKVFFFCFCHLYENDVFLFLPIYLSRVNEYK